MLVRLYASEEAAELEAATREFDDQLLKLLQRPDDVGAREALVSLRTRRELARSRLEQRTLRAPHARRGRRRARARRPAGRAGHAVLELRGRAGARATWSRCCPAATGRCSRRAPSCASRSTAFTPRPRARASTASAIRSSGPTEAARYLGRDLADAFAARRPGRAGAGASCQRTPFEADGERYEFAHGMHGKAETVVRNEPVAYAFVPGLRQWVDRVW